MARGIGGEARFEAEHVGQHLQTAIVIVERDGVLTIGRLGHRAPQYRKDIGSIARTVGISVHDGFHARFQADGEPLSRLAPLVTYNPVADIALAKIGHVDERHAAGIEAEHEQIARYLQRLRTARVEAHEARYHRLVDGAFAGTVDARVDITKGKGLLDQPPADRHVVHGPQDAHIERYRVAHHAPTEQIQVIPLHDLVGKCAQRQIDAVQIGCEALRSIAVVAGRAQISRRRQLRYAAAHELEKGDPQLGIAEPLHHIVRHEHAARRLQLGHDAVQQILFAVDRTLQTARVDAAARDDALSDGVPLRREQTNVGGDAPRLASVNDLKIDNASFSRDARTTQFYLNRYHKSNSYKFRQLYTI